jgi:hypothetical protein
MWPWIKRWRDWAMRDLWSMPRSSPQPQALHYSFEKAGLTLHDQPIPWNAEVVLVEALVRLPPAVPRRKAEFTLHLPDGQVVAAESLRQQTPEDRARLIFRFPPPIETVAAELYWRDKALGRLTLPVVSCDEFLQNLRLQLPTLFVRIGEQNVACQTFVSTQCRGIMASAVLSSPTSLVPLLDLGLQVEFRSERGGAVHTVPARLCSSQLADRQALVTVMPRGFPRRIGTWVATWTVADRPLATHRVRSISQRHFQRSLRITDTRFLIQSIKETVSLAQQIPSLDGVERVGPCFLVCSREPGMAGLCHLQVRVQMTGTAPPPQLPEQEVLITDGPTMVVPGTISSADMTQVSAFELTIKGEPLGLLPLSPIPIAGFTNEGGFKPPGDFSWSIAAEEELNDRLTRLLEERGRLP